MIIDNSTGDDLDFAVQDQPIDGGRQRKTELGSMKPGNKESIDGFEGDNCKVCLTPGVGSGLSDFTWVVRNVKSHQEIKFSAGAGNTRRIEFC